MRIIVKNFVAAIAMMHVEIQNRDARQLMVLERMCDANGNIIEYAETHRAIRFCMVPRRADGTEGIVHFAPHDQIGGEHGRACGSQCGIERERIHRCVAIERHQSRCRRG